MLDGRRRGRKSMTLGRGCAAAFLLALCCCSDEKRPDTQWGAAHLSWTIDARSAAVSCETLGATRFVALLITRGDLVDRYEAPCDAFALDAPLLVAGDDYMVNVSLQDDRGTPKTNALASSPFSITPGEVTRIEVNFGAAAWVDVSTAAAGEGTGRAGAAGESTAGQREAR
jgi:hypothetical protein